LLTLAGKAERWLLGFLALLVLSEDRCAEGAAPPSLVCGEKRFFEVRNSYIVEI
jgi:hypothetical protein